MCDHINVIIFPNNVQVVDGGIKVEDAYTDATMRCQDCNQELPLEDASLYDEDHISVGLSQDIVDQIED